MSVKKTSVKKSAAKTAPKPAAGSPGTSSPATKETKLNIAVVMEVKHRLLPFIWHTHHLVSTMEIEEDKLQTTERAARVAAKMASKHIPGVKCRVVCVEEVNNSMGVGVESLKKAITS